MVGQFTEQQDRRRLAQRGHDDTAADQHQPAPVVLRQWPEAGERLPHGELWRRGRVAALRLGGVGGYTLRLKSHECLGAVRAQETGSAVTASYAWHLRQAQLHRLLIVV